MSELSGQQVADVRRLRNVDGLPAREVATMVGCHELTVLRIAPGRPGKVSNESLRIMFEQESSRGLTIADVARRMGWWVSYKNPKPRQAKKPMADTSRVRRALGIGADSSHGRRYRRALIDAETAGLLAEAMGHEAWEATP